jgi:hypothetical protein
MQSYTEAVAAWQAPTPETGEAESKVIAELIRLAGPGLHAMTGPRFHGWVIGGSHPVGVAADWLTATWGQNVGNHHASPAGAAAEAVGREMAGRSARPAGGLVGRLRHRRHGRQLRLPRRRAQRGAAAGSAGKSSAWDCSARRRSMC